MSAYTNTPSNKSFLSPLGFKFQIKKTPNVNYYVQACSLPSLAMGEFELPNPFVKIPFAGDHLVFSPFTLTFKVDEDMKNYLEIYNWMKAIAFPDNFNQHLPLTTAAQGEGVYSDMSLTILSSAMNPIHEVTFIDAFPTSLNELMFDTRLGDVDYLECTCTFSYRTFNIKTL